MAVMPSPHGRLAQQPKVDRDREHAFFIHSLPRLMTISGNQVDWQRWMITSFDVEFGQQIHHGGLYGPSDHVSKAPIN
jgi:hypothetical protein